MVIEAIQGFLNSLPKVEKLSLPIIKPNPLKIEFEKDKYSAAAVYGTIDGVEPPLPFAESKLINASVCDSKRFTSYEGDCKAVYEIAFDLGDSYDFKPGDTIGIVPHNSSSEVIAIITHLDLMSVANDCYTLILDGKGKVPNHVPVQSTIRHVLTHCLDLRCILKKLFLLALSKHTKDEQERKILEYLCSKEGSAAYTSHVLNKNLCILDIFTIFKSCKPPIEVLLANLPRLLPRPFSIVNSGFKDKKKIKICFSVLPNNKGLTTGWLEDLILKDSLVNQIENLSINGTKEDIYKVPMYIRKNLSGFTMPDLDIPLILIGPGTGVAPFIGFLEAREYARENNPEITLGDVWLFFGCRNPELDFIYKTELEGFASTKVLTKLTTAFSRLDGYETKYIQDALRQNGEEVAKFINNGAAIFICGDLNAMATEVKNVFFKIFIEFDSLSEEDANKKIVLLEKDKRYFVDAWS